MTPAYAGFSSLSCSELPCFPESSCYPPTLYLTQASSVDGSLRFAHCRGHSPLTKGDGLMKRATLMLAALALLFGCGAQAKAGFVTLDDPLATGGTFASGVSGNNIVGYYYDATGYHGFLYDGTSYTTLN